MRSDKAIIIPIAGMITAIFIVAIGSEIEAQRAAELAGVEQLRAAERILDLDDKN